MPYILRITRAGKTIEIEKYYTSRYKMKGIKRGDKVRPTTEQQKKVNTRQAVRKLRILMNANFGFGDYHLVLDYIRKEGESPRTKEQMRRDLDVFLRECRKEYKKAGLVLKYIHVMEIGNVPNPLYPFLSCCARPTDKCRNIHTADSTVCTPFQSGISNNQTFPRFP